MKMICGSLKCEKFILEAKHCVHSHSFQNGSVQIIDGKLLSSQEYCFNLNGNESLDGFTDVMICEWYPETAKFTFYSIGKQKIDLQNEPKINLFILSHGCVISFSRDNFLCLCIFSRVEKPSREVGDVLCIGSDDIICRLDNSANGC